MAPVTIKLQCCVSSDIHTRKVKVENFSALKSRIAEIFSNYSSEELVFEYIDEDGDEVRLDSQSEFEELISMSSSSSNNNNNIIRLRLRRVGFEIPSLPPMAATNSSAFDFGHMDSTSEFGSASAYSPNKNTNTQQQQQQAKQEEQEKIQRQKEEEEARKMEDERLHLETAERQIEEERINKEALFDREERKRINQQKKQAEQEEQEKAAEEKAAEEARITAEYEARIKAEQEDEEARLIAEYEARLNAEYEAQKAAEQEQEEARMKAEYEARLKAEQEQEQEEARRKAEQEQEQEEARRKAAEEIAKLEALRKAAEQQQEEEALRKAAEEKAAEEARIKAEQEARIKAEEEEEREREQQKKKVEEKEKQLAPAPPTTSSSSSSKTTTTTTTTTTNDTEIKRFLSPNLRQALKEALPLLNLVYGLDAEQEILNVMGSKFRGALRIQANLGTGGVTFFLNNETFHEHVAMKINDLIEKKEFQLASMVAGDFCRLFPSAPSGHYNYAVTLVKQGEDCYDQAIAELQHCVYLGTAPKNICEDSDFSPLNKFLIFRLLGSDDEEIKRLQPLMELFPEMGKDQAVYLMKEHKNSLEAAADAYLTNPRIGKK